MCSVFLFINGTPYYHEKVTDKGHNTENPDTNLKRVVLHEVIAAGNFIHWGVAFHSTDGFFSIAAKDKTVQFPV